MTVSERIATLAPLIGEWQTTITMLDDKGSPGEVSKAKDSYRWSANGHFVEHDVDGQMEGAAIRSMEIIAADPDGPAFVTRSYDPDGSFSDFRAALDGTSWRIDGDKQRFAGTFSDDGTMLTGRWEQSNGTGAWAPLMDVVLRKDVSRR